MIKKTSLMSTPALIHKYTSKTPLYDLNGTQLFAREPNLSRSPKFKQSFIEKNKQKVEKRNVYLIKLFKPPYHQYLNLTMLYNSPFMKNNEIFQYLVNKLKNYRYGMINVRIYEEHRKAPKPIENKIREFTCHSLHEALLIPESYLRETRYFYRLFTWFTDVFKYREMKLAFKMERKDPQNDNMMDQDWIIRNNYKSNMPLELGQYQRRMVNANILKAVDKNEETSDKRRIVDFKRTFEEQYGQSHISDLTYDGEQKLYTLPSVNNPFYSKSTELLPVLNARVYMSKLVRNREQKYMDELGAYGQEWKKSRAQFYYHAVKNYFDTQKVKGKTLDNQSFLARYRSRKNQENSRPLSLGPKVLERIQAARLGVTCTYFRKNKENILKYNKSETYNSPVFHPLLSSNYFLDIKKKRLYKTYKNSFPRLLRSNEVRNSYESEDMIELSNEIDEVDLEDEYNCDTLFGEKPNEEDSLIDCIDGLGLSFVVGEKKEKEKCKRKYHK